MIMMMEANAAVPPAPTPPPPATATAAGTHHLLDRDSGPDDDSSASPAQPSSREENRLGDDSSSPTNHSPPPSSPKTSSSSPHSPNIPSSSLLVQSINSTLSFTTTTTTTDSSANNQSIVNETTDAQQTESSIEESQTAALVATNSSPPPSSLARTQSPPSPGENLEKIAKLLSSNVVSSAAASSGEMVDEGAGSANQLLTAAVAAATVAASGNLQALSPQEQWLASIAPTLIQMISGSQSVQPPPCSESSNDSLGQPNRSQSKRRKQSKPVRYHDELVPQQTPLNIFDAFLKTEQQVAKSLKQQFGSTDELEDVDDDVDDDDEEEEEKEVGGAREEGEVGSNTSSDEAEEASEQRGERSAAMKESPRTSPAASATVVAAEDIGRGVDGGSQSQPPSASDSPENMREKQQQQQQQQLLLANVFANLQAKLLHTVFCPQCNCAFASEDQLRAHIECEHMQSKLSFFQEAAAAAAAAAAASGPNSPEALQLKQLAEHLAMQKLHELQQQQQLQHQQQQNRQRKRKMTQHSPSSRSVSSEDDSDSLSPREQTRKLSPSSSPELDRDSSPVPKARRSSKDLNHNLLQSLHRLAGSAPPPPLSSTSPDQISADQHRSQQQQRQQPTAAQLANMFPPGMAPFLFPMLQQQQSSNSSSIPSSLRDHPSFASMQHHHRGGDHPGGYGQPPNGLGPSGRDASAMLNGVSGGPNGPTPSSAAISAAVAGQLRIFNPEAYCELCNKEFCNKYFLKTHKANKHGIYTPDSATGSESQQRPPQSSSSSSPMMHPPPPTSSSMLLPPSSMSNGHHHHHAATPITTTVSKASPNSNSNNSSSSADNLPFHLGGGQSVSPNHLMPPGYPGGPMRLNLNMSMVNLDSYCEICQKEFCNKYFLKKHKQKIHGFVFHGEQAIPPPNIAAQMAQAQAQLQQQSQQSPSAAHLQQLQQLHMIQQIAAQQHREREMAAVGRLSPFGAEAALDRSKAPTSPTLSGPLNGSSSIPSLGDKSPSNPVSSEPQVASAAVAAGLLKSETSENLRLMGVVNVDAFCRICCKEFCNKYFLRTHMVNKHGIHDGQTISTGKFSNNLLVNSQQQQQQSSPSPMNPFSGAFSQSENPSESEETAEEKPSITSDQLEKGQRDPASYGESGRSFLQGLAPCSSSSGIKCELCSQHIPTSFLLKMHCLYMHGIPFEKGSDEINDEEMAEEIKEEVEDDEESAIKNEDSDVETEVPSLMVSAELNPDGASEHSTTSSNTKEGQELQKLHSMLKGLSGSGQDYDGSLPSRNGDEQPPRPLCCHMCKYECDNRYFLRSHLIHEHGFPPTEEAFLQMFSATSGFNFLDQPKDLIPGGQQSASSEAYCELCNKEFCSKYFLKTHKQKIHNINVDGSPASMNGQGPEPPNFSPALLSSLYQQQQQQQRPPKSSSPKLFSSRQFSSSNPTIQATIKAAIAAGLVPSPPADQQLPLPPASSALKSSPAPPHRGPVMTGRNYCNICNKELCNKYFMKTHMLKMHNINIDEHPIEAQQSSTIGGVTCDICQKELCSKYFLKVHKQNTHGIYEDGSAPPVLLGANDSAPQNRFPGSRGSGGGSQSHGGSRGGSKSMQPPSSMHQNGPSMGTGELSALNPFIMQMMQNAAAAQAMNNSQDSSDSNSVCSSTSDKEAKLHGLDPVADAGNRLLPLCTEVCQVCERRFKSAKWLQAHMMADHGELLQMMRLNGEITTALAASMGANAETLSRFCVVCSQTFPDRLTMHIHQIKEHKMTSEELAVHLAGNLKMVSIMAAAAAAAQNQQEQSSPGVAHSDQQRPASRDDSPLARRTPHSRSSTPSHSPKPENETEMASKRARTGDRDYFNGNNNNNNSQQSFIQNQAAALQNLLLKQSAAFNPMALFAAQASGQGGNPWMSGLFGSGDMMQDDQSLLSHYPPMSGHGSSKNPPGKFVCHICFRTYRHSHSLQRHMITHRPKPGTPPMNSLTPTPPPSLPNQHQPNLLDLKPQDTNGTPPTAADGAANKPRNKRYRCSKCNKKFRTRELCLVHIRALHSFANSKLPSAAAASAATTTPLRIATPTTIAAATAETPKTVFPSPRLSDKLRVNVDSDEPLALNLRQQSDQHPLPPSPSASSEDDQNHQTTRLALSGTLSTATAAAAYLPQSPLEFEDGDDQPNEAEKQPKDILSFEDDDVDGGEEEEPRSETPILNLTNSSSNQQEPELSESEECEEKNAEKQSISRPLICVNGEKY